MNSIILSYNTSDTKEINSFLINNSHQICIPVAIGFDGGYAEKLFLRANRIEARDSNGNLIGLVAAYFNKETRIIWIPYVCVSKDLQGKGIASLMFRSLFEKAGQANRLYTTIGLEVLEDNNIAQNLYKKMGFISNEIINGKIQMWKVL